jgi:ABC-type transport system involved in multi-copper enzyme maturation permease subunit
VSLGRIWVIAANVFRDIIRGRVFYLIALFAIAFLLTNSLVPEVAAGTEDQIVPDLGLALISLLGLVITIFVGTGLVNKELEKRTILVMMAKPISRAEFILGKHLGLTAVLAVLVAAMTLLYIAILGLYRIPVPVASILISALFQLLELSLIAAVAILFGVFTSSLLATLCTFAVYAMGHLSQDLVNLGTVSKSGSIQQMTQIAYLVLPDLSRLNLKNDAVYGLQVLPAAPELLGNGLYAVVYSGVVLAIATLIFSRRQF